jgi:hypothetical protein
MNEKLLLEAGGQRSLLVAGCQFPILILERFGSICFWFVICQTAAQVQVPSARRHNNYPTDYPNTPQKNRFLTY